MLRTVGDPPSLWESILPEVCLGMPAELEAVDRLLDDSRFFEPYRAFFHARLPVDPDGDELLGLCKPTLGSKISPYLNSARRLRDC